MGNTPPARRRRRRAPRPDDHWLSVDAIAERLGVSRRTVYRLMESGDLPWDLVGSRRRVLASEVDAYVTGRAS